MCIELWKYYGNAYLYSSFQIKTPTLTGIRMTYSCTFLYPGDFRIDSTGTVYVNRGLDRERIATYYLVVGAYNFKIKAFNETSRPRQRNLNGMFSHYWSMRNMICFLFLSQSFSSVSSAFGHVQNKQPFSISLIH